VSHPLGAWYGRVKTRAERVGGGGHLACFDSRPRLGYVGSSGRGTVALDVEALWRDAGA
jgi:hypothetical protein